MFWNFTYRICPHSAPRILACAALSLALFGCQTAAQKRMMTLNTAATDINNRAQACYTSLRQDEKFKIVSKNLHLEPHTRPSLQTLANPNFATDEQIEVIYAFHNQQQLCRSIEIEAASKVDPLYAGFYANLYSQLDEVTIGLVKRTTNWGMANRMIQEAAVWRTENETKIKNAIDSDLEQDHQAEMEQRAKISEALQRWNYQQQTLNNQRAMISATQMQQHRNVFRQTNCRWVGASLNCTSF